MNTARTTSPTVIPRETQILSSDDVGRTVARIAHQIIEETGLDAKGSKHIILLGIPRGGVPLAKRLAHLIEEFAGVPVATGSLDITLYRDDLRQKPHRPVQRTSIPDGGVEGKIVILVDDVLYSGRSVRSALDALRDIGRPSAVQLAVLVDRGHRELPIRADYVGKNIPTSRTEDVIVTLTETDGCDSVVLCGAPPSVLSTSGEEKPADNEHVQGEKR
ncbi:bifunctional pyr operon transcriptional regulator/uracil phosphoribosyltransferase PyrR [Corynebacterium kroppenstedtii]|uniref:bifunctional pyr operon transcriptional regulator/uracil phosphoribosyltransferase PyrR n=1 Tax=Corynebacterium sp. PCR 32 TaxID=3351342 RepID=UPI0030A943FA